MANVFRVGPFLTELRNYGTESEPNFRFWARHTPSGRDEFYGLSAAGYTSAIAAIDAMGRAAAWLRASEIDETPTEPGECAVSVAGRSEVTEKVENPYA